MHNSNSFYGDGSTQQAMSTEDFLREHVFMTQKSSQQQYKPGQAVSTEDFLKYDVFGSPSPNQIKRKWQKQHTERMIFTTSMPPQTGPEDATGAARDFTPDNQPLYEAKLFTTPQGITFGKMELFRDTQGRIVRRAITCGSTARVHEYAYDQSGRLIMVNENGAVTEQYAYGAYGERVRDGLGNQYFYDGELRLSAIKGRDTRHTVGFHYDEKGQLVEKRTAEGSTRYAYNQYGGLTDVLLPDGKRISYTIDPAGRRVAKAANGSIVEKYCWYDMTRLMGVCDGNDQNGVQFLYGENQSGEQEWLPSAMRVGNTMYGLAFDQAGALLAIADTNGNVIQQIKHASFGSETNLLNLQFSLPVSFGGGLLDRDTGLIHLVYRDYDPTTAHFIQPDPLGHAAGDAEIHG